LLGLNDISLRFASVLCFDNFATSSSKSNSSPKKVVFVKATNEVEAASKVTLLAPHQKAYFLLCMYCFLLLFPSNCFYCVLLLIKILGKLVVLRDTLSG
jgi:hypothetical protein